MVTMPLYRCVDNHGDCDVRTMEVSRDHSVTMTVPLGLLRVKTEAGTIPNSGVFCALCHRTLHCGVFYGYGTYSHRFCLTCGLTIFTMDGSSVIWDEYICDSGDARQNLGKSSNDWRAWLTVGQALMLML